MEENLSGNEQTADSLNTGAGSANSTRSGMRIDKNSSVQIKNSLVIQALRKTQILLSYGSENGVEFAKSDIEIFTTFKEAAQDGQWTAQEEADFWATYSNIARAMGNIKVKEIEAITISDKPNSWLERVFKLRSSAAQRVANIYTMAALFFVLIMLGIQVYSLIGNNLLNSATEIQNSITELQGKRAESWNTIIQNGGKVSFMFDEIIAAEDAKSNPTDGAMVAEENPALRDANFQLREINKQLWEQNLELITLVFSINDWLISGKDKEVKELKDFYYSKDSTELVHGFYKETLYMNPEEAFAEHYDTIQMVLVAAKSPLDVMNIYILPLLYGLIGAFAFVLRSFTSQLENIDYSRDSNIKFLLRLFLGALVGLTVRMFMDTSDSSGLAMYSPLAISFISGYSVEFFFALIDNLIKRILGSDPQTTKKQEFSTEG